MSESPIQTHRTTYCVWEITLKCNLACNHCGSRAGEARHAELTTEQALDLVHQLRQVGIDEVTLIGGEAYLRADWLRIAEEIKRCGMILGMATGGLGIGPGTARRMKEIGFDSVGVSVDGLEETHDAIRGVKGSWQSAFRTLRLLRETGIPVSSNCQINARSWQEMPALYERLREVGIHSWQVQLTVPMGNAADNCELLLQPYELNAMFDMLVELAQQATRDGIHLTPGNNVGFYGPYDSILRGDGTKEVYYTGCEAGVSVLGIEADGAIKGCPSLPTTPYTGANIRERSLAEIMAYTEPLRINKVPRYTPESIAHLWGFCAGCDYRELCRGGCNWTAHVFFGRRGNNPYCHHRSLDFASRGLRERLVRDRPAPGEPFDHGTFAIVVEPADAPLPADPWERQAGDRPEPAPPEPTFI